MLFRLGIAGFGMAEYIVLQTTYTEKALCKIIFQGEVNDAPTT